MTNHIAKPPSRPEPIDAARQQQLPTALHNVQPPAIEGAQTPAPTGLRQAFDAAFTPKVLREVTEHARRHAAKLRRSVAWLSAEDLVHTAIVKTLDGSQRWNPTCRPLAHHLLGAIDGEISHALRHARDFPEVRLDTAGELAAAAARVPGSQAVAEQARAVVVAALGSVACRDVGIRALLDAYEKGAWTRQEVLEISGMTPREYAASYKRLMYSARSAACPVADLATNTADHDRSATDHGTDAADHDRSATDHGTNATDHGTNAADHDVYAAVPATHAADHDAYAADLATHAADHDPYAMDLDPYAADHASNGGAW